ncbi:MAG: hypothetical protein ABI348_09030 [Nitrososphaera sp.]
MAGGVKGLGLPFVVLLLAAAMALPAAYGQSSSSAFSVTTNKSVYDSNDRVIVAGTVDMDNGGDNNNSNNNNDRAIKFVAVRVTKDDAVCGQQLVRVERDGSFISRPMKMSCGPGNYNVTATYAGQSVAAGFRIAGKEPEQSSELAQIRDTIAQAMERANARIKELVQANVPIPAQAADKYQMGVYEASLATQSAEYGDADGAHKHADAAIGYFAETVDLLSPENTRALSQQSAAAGEDGESRLAAANDHYGRLEDLYRTLAGLAEKNGVSDPAFEDIQALLVEGKRLLGINDIASAEPTLALTESMLDKARAKLVGQVNDNNNGNSDGNSNGNAGGNNNNDNSNSTTTVAAATTTTSSEAANLLASADRLEKRAEKQLAEAGSNAQAEGQIREAMNLIDAAKTAIGDGDYSSARGSLSTASKVLIDASRLVYAA